jgi:hypothetical protein
MLYCITFRSKFDARITGWYTGSESRWSTDHTRKKLFDHKEEAEPVAMALRELCPHNAENINVERHGVGDAIPATSKGFAVPRNRLVQNPEGAPKATTPRPIPLRGRRERRFGEDNPTALCRG